MTESDYLKKLKDVSKENRGRIRSLQIEFLKTNNSIKKGNIIVSDVGVMIRVDRVAVSDIFLSPRKIPCVEYHGDRLAQNLTTCEPRTRACIWGPRVATVIK